MELTLQLAKRLSKKYLNKIEDVEKRRFLKVHSKEVVRVSLVLSKNKKLDASALKISGFLHDIGYSINEENHARHSISILEKEDIIIPEKIKDCILNHGSSASPITKEGKIFQIADKVSFLNPVIIKLLISMSKERIKHEDIEFLRRSSKTAVDLLENFKF